MVWCLTRQCGHSPLQKLGSLGNEGELLLASSAFIPLENDDRFGS